MRVGIIGTGNIGTDLLYKLLKIPGCKVVAFVGRRESTKKLPSNVPYQSNEFNILLITPVYVILYLIVRMHMQQWRMLKYFYRKTYTSLI